MITFSNGQNTLISNLSSNDCLTIQVESTPSHLDLNFFAFILGNNNKVRSDDDVIFFNQTSNQDQSVVLDLSNNSLKIQCNQLSNDIQKIDLTVSLDEPYTLQNFQTLKANFLNDNGQIVGEFNVLQAIDLKLTGITLCSIYLNKNQWKLKAVGQGFQKGLEALVTSYGATVDQPEASSTHSNHNTRRLSLDKRIEQEAPQLLSLVKQAKLSLEKVGLQNHVAKVALCLDISGSMADLYYAGYVQELANRILALATRFDDDGEIDVFLFGEFAYRPDPMSISDCQNYVQRIMNIYQLEGATHYHEAMHLVRKFYFPNSPNLPTKQSLFSSLFTNRDHPKIVNAECPVYVMFVTDGDAHDEAEATQQMVDASYEPIFWQFMAIGNNSEEFYFLNELDNMKNRFIDNANFFCIHDPKTLSDEKLYSLMMGEYPDWINKAKSKGLL